MPRHVAGVLPFVLPFQGAIAWILSDLGSSGDPLLSSQFGGLRLNLADFTDEAFMLACKKGLERVSPGRA